MIIQDYFHLMVERKASDLHLCSGTPPRLRVAGEIVTISEQPLSSEEVQALVAPITPERNRREWEDCHDTDFAHEIGDTTRFRCNVFMDRNGVGAVFRLIPSKILGFAELGLPEPLKKLCFLHKGLVLVTGPTGSGKSTTLAALIDFINENRTDHIITIEDPIEFVHKNKKCLVNQREVQVHTDSFKRALRAALREDPDIVLVGEMRDLETVRIALETAETGHLVFATLHTNSAAGTVDRLINQFPADEQAQVRASLADGLRGVISQTLCKRKGGGRVVALEILLGSYALSANIREGKVQQIPMAIQTGRKDGMCFLNDSLLELVARGTVEPVEAYAKSISKEDLIKRLSTNPNARSPRGQPWTEEELIKVAEGNGNGNGSSPTPPPQLAETRSK